MMNLTLLAFEKLALTIILGGGIIMAACVRPLLIEKLSQRSDSNLISTIEGISIGAWNKYNRFAFVAALTLMLIDVLRLISGLTSEFWHFGITLLIAIALIRKFMIDKQLQNRLINNGPATVGSKEQNDGHFQVELLSKAILILALMLIIFPI